MRRTIEIEIGCCGDCPYYSWKKHRCSHGAIDYGDAQDNFYLDCPLKWHYTDSREYQEKPEVLQPDGKETAQDAAKQVLQSEI